MLISSSERAVRLVAVGCLQAPMPVEEGDHPIIEQIGHSDRQVVVAQSDKADCVVGVEDLCGSIRLTLMSVLTEKVSWATRKPGQAITAHHSA